MKKNLYLSVVALCMSALFFFACKKQDATAPGLFNSERQMAASGYVVAAPQMVYSSWPETMESGTKAAYATADVTLSTGSWNFNDALIGNLSGDHKNGTKAARIENTGMLTMNFNLTNGASAVSILHAEYGTDASSTWALYYSTNSGSTWTQTGSNITTASTSLSTASFTLNVTGNVRFQLRKLSGGRLNIDDISVSDNSGAPPPPDNDNMGLGNPSGAVTKVNVPNNYLLVKTQYDLAYNNSKGECGWASWHLDASNLGSTARCDCFNLDTQLPASFFRAGSTAYSGSGFDRGHQCPSADRTDNDANNAATFLMSNMLPQAPNLNQITWGNLEDYERTLVGQGNELYIICGGYGTGGTGSNGSANSVNSGHINVPAHCWKVIVVLPAGTNDINRVTTSTRVIAVDMPNVQTVNGHPWGYYRTTVDAIEAATGYNFLSNVPASIQNALEAVVDNGPTN